MINKSNLTPRERFLLLIQSDVQKMKTGKESLTPADKEALENWKSQNNFEAREWNRLNEGWKYSGKIELEVELIYKDAQVAHLSQLPIIMNLLYYPAHQEISSCIRTLKNLKKVTLSDAIKIGEKQKTVKLQSGLDFDYAIYQLAFELLSKEDRDKMNELYPDIESDHQYLDEEEIIANLYNGKKELTEDAKKKLAALVAEKGFNKFANEYQLFHYFACIPLAEVGRRFLESKDIKIDGKTLSKTLEEADENGITSDDITKALESYASEHKTNIGNILEAACLEAINNGLLEECMPLVTSNQSELLQRWFKTRLEAKAILLKHIEMGELKLRERTSDENAKQKLYSKGLYDTELGMARQVVENLQLDGAKDELGEKIAFENFNKEVITGESLYGFQKDYEFVKEFKERADQYDPNLGIVYADDDPEQKGEHLDKELMICGLNRDGEASFFSLYGMAMHVVSTVSEKENFFEEVLKDGKNIIRFKDAGLEAAFRMRRNNLISGYAQLLAFEELLNKLSKEYEADMTHHVSERVKMLRGYIEQTNDAIRSATGTRDKLEKSKFGIFRKKHILEFEEELIIDIAGIEPDRQYVSEHESRLRGILGKF